MNMITDVSHTSNPLELWLLMLRKSAFINDYVAESYIKRNTILGICTIVSLFALAVISACSVSLLGSATLPANYNIQYNATINQNSAVITGEAALWVTVAFNITTLIITALLGSIHSIKELFGWDKLINELKEYVNEAIALSGTLEINISLGIPPTEEFMKTISQKMIDFRNKAPNIGTTNFIAGEQRWNEYISNPKSVKTMMMSCEHQYHLKNIVIDE